MLFRGVEWKQVILNILYAFDTLCIWILQFYFFYFRADYWKSQAKKYCDFCKCWLADNKPSIEFHEKGRKHKENVAKSLKAISRRSRRDEKESCRVDQALKKMESAALEAYRKDIEANANVDLSSRNISDTLDKNNLAISSKNCWHETKNKDGKICYRNIETNETVQIPPTCGYLTIAQQEEEAFKVGKQQLEAVKNYRSKTDLVKLEEEKQRVEEERAAAAREKMKERRVVEEPEPVTFGPILEEHSGPYGAWRTIESTRPKEVDLGLPAQEEYIPVVTAVPEAPVREFKEKSVKTLGNEGDSATCVSFKKRRFGGNQKRNVRQRFDDD